MKRAATFILVLAAILAVAAVAAAETHTALKVPWSGYWWPLAQGGLVTGTGYEGHPAPLEKYDRAVTGTENGPATAYGLKNYYKRGALVWEGLCFDWAAASVMEREPLRKGVYGGVAFRRGDKKGILTAVYDGAQYRFYPIHDPEDFHGLLETFIRDQRIPIIMDLGTNGEKWNYPIYEYDLSFTESGDRRHYTVTVYFADDNVQPDYQGTRIDTRTYYFYYDLSGSVIVGSGWEMGSQFKAPVNASEVYGTVPRNPGMDLGTARAIAFTDDDPYEPNDDMEEARELTTGAYLGIAANTDFFKVSLLEGDRLRVWVAELDDDGPVTFRVYGPSGAHIATGCPGEEIDLTASVSGPHFIEIVPENGGREPVYRLYVDQRLPWAGFFPADMGGMWSGSFSLVNASGKKSRVILSRTDRTGTAVSSVPLDGDLFYHSGLLDDLPLAPPDFGYLRVDSDVPLQGALEESYGGSITVGGNLMSTDEASPVLYFPHIARTGDWRTLFGLIQTGTGTEEVEITVYDAAGVTVTHETVTLGPGEKREDERFTGIFPARGSSMVVRAGSGLPVLLGYGIYKYETLDAREHALIPVSRNTGSRLALAHVACATPWWTGVAVLNAWGQGGTARFEAFDGAGRKLAAADRYLGPREQAAVMVSGLFPGVSPETIASLTVRSLEGGPLAGLAVYGDSAGLQIDGLSLSPATPVRSAFVPLVASSPEGWTGFAFRNEGAGPGLFHVDLLDNGEEILDRASWTLDTGGVWVGMLENLFGPRLPGEARCARVTSEDVPMSGLYMMGDSDGATLWGDKLAF